MPPVEFDYTRPAVVRTRSRTSTRGSLENLPTGLDGAAYRWIDLDGEGIRGPHRAGGAWFYKRNLSAAACRRDACDLAPLERVALRPNVSLRRRAAARPGRRRRPTWSCFDGPTAGAVRTRRRPRAGVRSFRSPPRLAWDVPDLRFVDLDGDGHADVLITEDDAFTWYPSLAEDGFGRARRVAQAERRGARSAPGPRRRPIQSDLPRRHVSGDGLTDLVRIRNGEVCYWPNLGYGRFGAKVTMDNAPVFDHPDQFDPATAAAGRHRRLRHHRPHLPAPRRRPPLLQPVRQRLERRRGTAQRSRASTTSARSHVPRPARQRHRLPGLVLAAARRRAAGSCATST